MKKLLTLSIITAAVGAKAQHTLKWGLGITFPL